MARPMRILAIDPGTTESAILRMEPGQPLKFRILPNAELVDKLAAQVVDEQNDVLVIEMVAAMGMPVGFEVFETCVWVGRMIQAYPAPELVQRITRSQVKLALCGSARANDANVRQRLIDLYGGSAAIGRKATPGPLYGVKSHIWSALAVAHAFELRETRTYANVTEAICHS